MVNEMTKTVDNTPQDPPASSTKAALPSLSSLPQTLTGQVLVTREVIIAGASGANFLVPLQIVLIQKPRGELSTDTGRIGPVATCDEGKLGNSCHRAKYPTGHGNISLL